MADKLLDSVRGTDAGAVLTTLSFGAMSPEMPTANDDLFVALGNDVPDDDDRTWFAANVGRQR